MRIIEENLRGRSRYGLAVLLGILTVGTVLFLGDLQSRYRSAISDAERADEKLAAVLAEQAGHTFDALDRSLSAAELVRTNVLASLYPAPMANRALQLLRISSPFMTAIEWTNARGDVIAHSYEGEAARPNISDLPFFETQRGGNGDHFLIARPFRSENGQWNTMVSRRLTNADGSFAGIISATLDRSHFASVFRALKPASDGSIVLMLRDGAVLTREPFVDGAMRVSFGNDGPIREYLSKADAGAIEADDAVDGIARLIAFKTVPGFPLVVVVFGGARLLRQDRALARQAGLFRAALENLEQGLIVVDEKGTLPVCNRRAMELLDLPATLMASNPNVTELITFQTERGEFFDATEKMRSRLTPQSPGETRNVHERKRPNGTILEVHTVPFAGGGVVRTYTDVTARRAAEAALRDSEARYRLLADNSTDMIFNLDLALVRRYVSPASFEILGYLPEDLLGQKSVNMIHPDDVPLVEETYRAVLNGRERASVTNRSRHRDGRWIWVQVELRLVRDKNGRPNGILGALRDVSAHKSAEDDAIAARKLAEQAAATQAQFLATMSHELRTPLNSVLGFAEIILDRSDLIPEIRRQVGLIQTSGAYLLTAVNDVLDFSKIEEGKLDIVPTVFSLFSLVDESISVVRESAERKHLNLVAQTDRNIPAYVSGDENRIRQVLLNLLNNAIKFTPSGRVALTVEYIGSHSDQKQVRFEICDTGIGVPGDKLHRLFQRFSQVDGSTSREYGGTGLGLAISKRLVELMGGEIGVESDVGDGSTFWFTLCLPPATAAGTSNILSQTRGKNTRPLRILVAEDLDVNQEIVCSMLEASGHHVDMVSDGSDAVTAVETCKYDVVLMDIQMPGMDGVTATKHIRSLPEPARHVPIIAMTANVLRQQIESFRDAGMNGHVGKPLKRNDLLAAIERSVSQPATLSLAPPAIPNNSDVVLDAETFAAVFDLLGRQKVNALLGKLGAQLRSQLSGNPDNTEERAEIAREAHKLISTAGMLGFSVLSDRCARLETAALANQDDVTAVLNDARAACQSVLAEITTQLARPDDLARSG
jgi:PAS domain S-box-containing protein